MTERQAAPRRPVVAVRRIGGTRTANVRWEHELDCGHVEIRARRSPYGTVGCVACAIPVVEPAPMASEVRIAYLRTALANRLRVPPEAVEVVVTGTGEVAHAMAWLDAAAVKALLADWK